MFLILANAINFFYDFFHKTLCVTRVASRWGGFCVKNWGKTLNCSHSMVLMSPTFGKEWWGQYSDHRVMQQKYTSSHSNKQQHFIKWLVLSGVCITKPKLQPLNYFILGWHIVIEFFWTFCASGSPVYNKMKQTIKCLLLKQKHLCIYDCPQLCRSQHW